MKITIIYDNTSFNKNLIADWGFSALVGFRNRRILFDTGTKGSILLENMKKLNINPQDIDEVFISHSHYDHTGGLSTFLELSEDIKLYAPPSFRGIHNHAKFEYDYRANLFAQRYIFHRRIEKNRAIVNSKNSKRLSDNCWLCSF